MMKKCFLWFLCFSVIAVFLKIADVRADIGDTSVARWKDNKKGAYSMGFDDSMQSQHDFCIPHLIKRELVGSFWVNPSSTRYAYGIDTWESTTSRAGIELCDHTMEHNGANFIEEADYEIGETARIIRSLNYPGKSRFLLFLRGGATSWPEGYEFLIQKHELENNRGGGERYGGDPGGSGLVEHARQAMEKNTWHMMATHGTGPYCEWLGFETAHFLALLDYLESVKDRLWIGTCGDVHKYVQERNSAKVTVLENDKSGISLDLTSDMDPDMYDYPLTLLTEVPSAWKYCHVRQGDLQSIYPVKSGTVQYDAVPGFGGIRLTDSAMDTSPPGKPVVRDGSGTDIAYTPNTHKLSANWDPSSDPESGISRYWYKIGTTPGGSDVIDWIDNGRSTNVTVTRTNLSLVRGETYYFTIKAVNGVGLSSEGTSNGQSVTSTPDCIVFAEGFEGGITDMTDTNTGSENNTMLISGFSARKGHYGMVCYITETDNVTVAKRNVSELVDNYVRFYFKLSHDFKLPRGRSLQLLNLTNNVGFFIAGIYLSSTGDGPYIYARCVDNKRRESTLPASSGYPPGIVHVSTGDWHCIDIRTKADAGNGGVELWIDGVRKSSYLHKFTNGWELRNITVGAMNIGSGVSGYIYFDDIDSEYQYTCQSRIGCYSHSQYTGAHLSADPSLQRYSEL